MKYRILIINWQDISNPLGGGAEVHAHEIFRRIASKGHQVTLLCSGFKGAPKEETIDGILIIRKGNRSLFNYYVPFAYRKLRRRQKFDIVIDDINKIPFFTPWFINEPLVAIVHHLFGQSIFMEAVLPQALYVYLAERAIKAVYRKIRFITVSESTHKELSSYGLNSHHRDIVYNGIDHVVYRPIPELKSKVPLIGYFGRLKRYKCIEHIIHVFPDIMKKIPDVQLLIVGEGDHRKKLEKMVIQQGLNERIHFTGAVKNQQKIGYLNQMWIAVNPSPKEGWGLTVMETNGCGVPVVAADSPGLCALLQNKSLRQKLGQGAFQWAKRFSWDHSASKTLKIIEEVCHTSPKLGTEQLEKS